MGDYEGARYRALLRHGGGRASSCFVHVLMVALVPRTFPTMITGDEARMKTSIERIARRRSASSGACSSSRACRSARWRCSPAASSPTTKRAARADGACRAGTTARRPGCSIRSGSRPNIPRAASRKPFPFNAYYSEDEVRDRRRRELQARARRHDQGEEAVDAAGALRAAAGLAGHAPHLRRGLERDRQVERRALLRLPRSASAPTPTREVRRLQVRRRLLRPASTWRPRCIRRRMLALQLRRPDPAAEVRLSDEAAHPDQARLQEPEAHRRASS